MDNNVSWMFFNCDSYTTWASMNPLYNCYVYRKRAGRRALWREIKKQVVEEKIEINEKITEIQVNDEYVLKLEQDGVSINLGNAMNLKDRMYFVKKLLEEEKENKGTIYVNGNLNEGFSPYFSATQ